MAKKWWIGLGGILLMVGLAIGLWPTAERAKTWRLAQQQINDRHFDDALTTLDQQLTVWPSHAEGQLAIAQTARRLGLIPRAEKHLRQYEQLGGDPEILAHERILLAVQRGEMGRFDGGLAFVEAHPDHRESQLILEAMIQGYIRQREPIKAIAIVDRWSQRAVLPADRIQADIWRGECYRMVGDGERAVEAFRRALSAEPANAAAQLRLAEAIVRSQPQEAMALLNAMPAESQAQPITRLIRAQCERILGETDAARDRLDQLHQVRPDDVVVLLERGLVALDLNDLAGADRWLRQAEERAPDLYELIAARLRWARQTQRTVEVAALEKRLRDLESETKQRIELFQSTIEKR